jgi:acetylornithine deacetylase
MQPAPEKSLQDTLHHLGKLVACDSRNPPRNITEGGPLFSYLRSQLQGFTFAVQDHGHGCVSMLATRGQTRTVFNFHLDTVPTNEQWSLDPLALQVKDERAYGLGACDIKGAAAAMLSAVNRCNGPVALLLTSDEEAGNSTCIKQFLDSNHGFSQAIVAEPTQARAVCAHRGIVTANLEFRGHPGHASAARAMEDSAIHRAVEWSARALDWVRGHRETEFQGLKGLRFNIGQISGGIKPNMIAAQASLSLGLRTLPGQDGETLLQDLARLGPAEHLATITPRFLAPALPDGLRGHSGLLASQALARRLELDVGPAVDFWTEAALFGQAGLDTLVYGSGDIAQAHTADEWVSLEQLATVTTTYERIISHGYD